MLLTAERVQAQEEAEGFITQHGSGHPQVQAEFAAERVCVQKPYPEKADAFAKKPAADPVSLPLAGDDHPRLAAAQDERGGFPAPCRHAVAPGVLQQLISVQRDQSTGIMAAVGQVGNCLVMRGGNSRDNRAKRFCLVGQNRA